VRPVENLNVGLAPHTGPRGELQHVLLGRLVQDERREEGPRRHARVRQEDSRGRGNLVVREGIKRVTVPHRLCRKFHGVRKTRDGRTDAPTQHWRRRPKEEEWYS
jgi:hypothetical protein